MKEPVTNKYSTEDYTPEIILARLNKLRKEGKFCDLRIVVDGAEFLAHKIILAAFSPHLQSLFSNGYSGTRHFVLELNNVEGSLVEILLEYAYTTEIQFTENNVSGLLHLAKFFKASPLFWSCCQYMENNISAQNCLAYYKLAKMYSSPSLEEKTESHIRENFAVICEQNDFLELLSDNLADILGSGTIDVQNEIIFNAAIKWLRFQEEERKSEMPKILSRIQLEMMDSKFLRESVSKVPAIRDSPACMRLVQEALWFNLPASERTERSLREGPDTETITKTDENVIG